MNEWSDSSGWSTESTAMLWLTRMITRSSVCPWTSVGEVTCWRKLWHNRISTNLPDCRTTPELFDYSECFWLDGIRQNKLGYERWNKRSRSWKFQADSVLINVSNCLQVSSQNRCRHISTKKEDSNPEVSSSIPTIPTINRVFPRRLSSLAHKPPSNVLQSWDMTV